MGTIPIKITPKQKRILDDLKVSPRETYSDAFRRLCNSRSKSSKNICRRLKDDE